MLGAGLVGVGAYLYWRFASRPSDEVDYSTYTRVTVLTINEIIESLVCFEGKNGELPVGAHATLVRKLVKSGCLSKRKYDRLVEEERIKVIGGVTYFVDALGNPIVYHFPARKEGVRLELYGVGLNGRDEGGEGDDVQVSESLKLPFR